MSECWPLPSIGPSQTGADHPDVMVAALGLLAQHAVAAASVAGGGAARLFDRLQASAAASGRRYPSHLPLEQARGALERLRRLFDAQGPLETLHRKAILLYLDGAYRDAGGLMQTVVALAPRREAEAMVFLAECLIGWLAHGTSDADERAAKRELVDQVLNIAERLPAAHRRLQAARDAAAALDDVDGG